MEITMQDAPLQEGWDPMEMFSDRRPQFFWREIGRVSRDLVRADVKDVTKTVDVGVEVGSGRIYVVFFRVFGTFFTCSRSLFACLYSL